ncbi:unnamed protein product [Heterobilharzia americana]|nr:unnamed protein product [Heterobilharzia americana]CAH8539158.1 unnamed protein product [Heterobilharzia americana]
MISLKSKCGCKGIRTCALCEHDSIPTATSEFTFCSFCNVAEAGKLSMSNGSHIHENSFLFPGVEVIHNFIDEAEEAMLIDSIDGQRWFLSQSGRKKQDYGPKVNFKRQKVHIGNFTGLPAYCKFLITRYNNRLKQSTFQSEFLPVELCNLEYESIRGACIAPHYDDSWLWGDRLVTVNLCGSTCLTFTLPTNGFIGEINDEIKRIHSSVPENTLTDAFCVRVPLHRRSLIVVSGPARYLWQHEIRRSDIPTRRVAMTFRELSGLFTPNSPNLTKEQVIGKQLLEIASTYDGQICNGQNL